MTPKHRMGVQNEWRAGVLRFVVATIAFGARTFNKSCISLSELPFWF